MRKLLLSIIAMLCFCCTYAQDIPRLAPVSPQAASIGKYGDLPVNLASGRINYTIPVFTIKEGNFELPIYLSYNHSGLLAEEDPSVLGLGWTFHAGGMITRQLKGRPDEEITTGYIDSSNDWVIPYHYNLWADLTYNEKVSKTHTLFSKSAEGRLDTEPDKFILNAPSISGNFSYNENEEVIFYPHKNYQIDWDYNLGFEVIDDRGIKYEFHKKETTVSEPITNNEQLSPPMDYVSSWQLTNIDIPESNSNIVLKYGSGTNYHKEMISESISRIIYGGGIARCDVSTAVNKSKMSTDIYTFPIEEITYSGGSVHFDIVKQTGSNSSSGYNNYLYKITIKDTFEKVIASYEFIFDDTTSNFKLLTGIKKYDKNNNELPFYKFDYKQDNNTPLPKSIDYRSQDTWGYYNGKANVNLSYGDRSVDFSKASLGALTKITYPTGGYTEIQYESNDVQELPEEFLTSGQYYTTPINTKKRVSTNTIDGNRTVSDIINIEKDQIIKVTMSANADLNSRNKGVSEAFSSIKLNGYSGTEYIQTVFVCDTDDSYNTNCAKKAFSYVENQEGGGTIPTTSSGALDKQISYFKVKAGVELLIEASAVQFSDAYATANVSVDYYVEDPDEKLTVNVGGIRVSSSVDCFSEGDCISKKYNYVDENGFSSGQILSEPIHKNKYSISENGIPCTVEQYSANSKVPLASFQGAPVLYNRVEVLHNNNETNGKTIKYFTFHDNKYLGFPFPRRETQDWKKGNLLKEEIYGNINNELHLIESKENTYQVFYPYSNNLTTQKHSIGLVTGRVGYRYNSSGLLNGNPDDYVEKSYVNRPEFYHLTFSKTTNYFGNDSISSSIVNTYDDLTGYLKEQNLINSKLENIKTTYTYPNSGDLFLQNRINTPIITEVLKEQKKLSTQEIQYNYFDDLYLPSMILTSKGDEPLEPRIVYHDYDDGGNPKEISKADETHIVYVWGYNQSQPIAKIEGYNDFSTTEEALINSAISLSNVDNDRTLGAVGKEGALRIKLQELREALPEAQVSTYTYDPLIGVTSMTDPRGYTMYYEYDGFNRLQYVKDSNGNILKENQYNYKN